MNTIIVGDKMYRKKALNYDSLEPVIDDLTLDLHYNKHYQKYLDNLNKLVGNYSGSVEDIIKNIDDFDLNKRGDILYNVGGVFNHELYFSSMNNKPFKENKLVRDLIKQYGSFDNLKKEFIKVASKLVGSGYTFLVLNDKCFDIVNMSNQEVPYTYGLVPLLAIDLWEHAYYLKYKNNRDLYINNFFSIIDFDNASNIYEKETN